MGFVQYFVLLLSAQLVLTNPMGADTKDDSECVTCPAGEFRKSCTKCAPCPAGSYVETMDNREENCHLCFRDCSPKYHLRVVQNCTSTTPLKCQCEPGFSCVTTAEFSDNCKKCEKIEDTAAATVISDRDKHTSPPPSLDPTKPCQPPMCSSGAVTTVEIQVPSKQDNTKSHLVAILGPVIFLAVMILFYIFHPRNERCLRQTLAKLCHEGQDAALKSVESTRQFPRDSFSAKQQASSFSATSLGSVHVHNPGTVIFSLLSQFTGQVGPTILGGRRPESVSNEEEVERGCPVFHPTSSPSVHLSEEERSTETDIYSPFQEQGKDCHVSKEEVL